MRRHTLLAVTGIILAAVCGAMDQQALRRMGGLVSREGTGRLLIIDRQKRVAPKVVLAKADYLARLLGIRTGVTTNAAERATVTILLTDGEGESAQATSGARVGVVELDGPSPGGGVIRDFNAAFARIAATLFVPEGRKTNVSRREIEDVFAGDAFTMMAVSEVRRFLPQAGFAPTIIATYETACREGWAPAPTNDAQHAIWARMLDEKERGPTNPILILPPNRRK